MKFYGVPLGYYKRNLLIISMVIIKMVFFLVTFSRSHLQMRQSIWMHYLMLIHTLRNKIIYLFIKQNILSTIFEVLSLRVLLLPKCKTKTRQSSLGLGLASVGTLGLNLACTLSLGLGLGLAERVSQVLQLSITTELSCFLQKWQW